ncbi:MAG: molybdopterin-dependent oxidoreductase, partial [Deinococcales bacterium]
VPIADLRLKEHPVLQRDKLTVAAPYRVDLMKHAGRALHYPAGGEAALFQALQAVAEIEQADDAEGSEGAARLDDTQRAALGMSVEDAQALVKRLRGAGNAVLVYGGFVLATREAAAAATAFAKAVEAKALILGPMANSHGLELVGLGPSHERYAYPDMLEGSRALILSNLDPARDPDVRRMLEQKDFLVVHDLFLTETAQLADVVLPAKSVYEKDGTVVNLEGRFLGVHAAPVEGGESQDFIGLVGALGEALGQRLEGRSLRSARRVLRKRFELDPVELGPEGHLHRPRSRQSARVAIRSREAVEGNVLVTPSMLRIEYLERNPHLLRLSGGPSLRIHPDDAALQNVADGDAVQLRVGGLLRRATVVVDDRVPPGLMLLPTLPEQPVGLARADLSTLERAERELEVAG